MNESSRSRVTVTLGRGGRVVKRASDTDFLDSSSRGIKKPSAKERLGISSDVTFSNGNGVNNKRHREHLVYSDIDRHGNAGIGKNDLRLKLNTKNACKRARYDDEKVTDLREKLSRMGQPPPSSSSSESYPRMSEPRVNPIVGRTPSNRTADDLERNYSSRSRYASWSDHSRRRSPESRNLSPPTNIGRIQNEQSVRVFDSRIQNEQSVRVFDDVRDARYMSRGMLDAPRPMHSSPFPTRSTMPPVSSPLPPHYRTSIALPPSTIMKPSPSSAPIPPLLNCLPPLGNALGKAPPLVKTVEDHQTIDSLLNSLELGKYSILFKAEEVDMPALKQMGETDLKELGIPMGPRKKILLAVTPSGKRQQR